MWGTCAEGGNVGGSTAPPTRTAAPFGRTEARGEVRENGSRPCDCFCSSNWDRMRHKERGPKGSMEKGGSERPGGCALQKRLRGHGAAAAGGEKTAAAPRPRKAAAHQERSGGGEAPLPHARCSLPRWDRPSKLLKRGKERTRSKHAPRALARRARRNNQAPAAAGRAAAMGRAPRRPAQRVCVPRRNEARPRNARPAGGREGHPQPNRHPAACSHTQQSPVAAGQRALRPRQLPGCSAGAPAGRSARRASPGGQPASPARPLTAGRRRWRRLRPPAQSSAWAA